MLRVRVRGDMIDSERAHPKSPLRKIDDYLFFFLLKRANVYTFVTML